MGPFIGRGKDFWAGLLFVALALAFALLGRDLPFGTPARMGPAMFPMLLAALLGILGLLLALKSLRVPGAAVERFELKGLALVLGAMILFGALVRTAGLVAAVPALVVASAYASMHFRLPVALVMAVILTLFCFLVFVHALGLPVPLVGPLLSRWV